MAEDRYTRVMRQRSQRRKIALGAVILIAGLLGVNRLFSGPLDAAAKQSEPVTEKAAVQQGAASQRAFNRPDWPIELDRNLFQANEQNPAPVQTDAEAITRAARGSIRPQVIVNADEPTVMIDGQVHRVGAVVAGYTIVAILERAIEVERDGITVRVDL